MCQPTDVGCRTMSCECRIELCYYNANPLWPLCAAGSRGGLGLGSGRRRSGPHPQLLLLRLDELAIVSWIEVEKRPTRRTILNAALAHRPGGADGDYRHRQRANRSSDYGKALHEAGGSSPGARRDHRSRQAGKNRFAPIFGKWNSVNFRETAQHIKLDPADSGDVDKRHGIKPAAPDHSDKRSTNCVAA